jgi:hypothetical protein
MMNNPTEGNVVRWLDAAPEDEQERREFLIRLITILSFKVDYQTMEEAVVQAFPCHGMKRCATK